MLILLNNMQKNIEKTEKLQTLGFSYFVGK